MREIDMSTRAIAAATGTSIGTVHSELSRCSELNTTNPAPVVGVDGKACPSSQPRREAEERNVRRTSQV